MGTFFWSFTRMNCTTSAVCSDNTDHKMNRRDAVTPGPCGYLRVRYLLVHLFSCDLLQPPLDLRRGRLSERRVVIIVVR